MVAFTSQFNSRRSLVREHEALGRLDYLRQRERVLRELYQAGLIWKSDPTGESTDADFQLLEGIVLEADCIRECGKIMRL
jgi:hypothetical protein